MWLGAFLAARAPAPLQNPTDAARDDAPSGILRGGGGGYVQWSARGAARKRGATQSKTHRRPGGAAAPGRAKSQERSATELISKSGRG